MFVWSLAIAEAMPWLGESRELESASWCSLAAGLRAEGFQWWRLPHGLTLQAAVWVSWAASALCRCDSFSGVSMP